MPIVDVLIPQMGEGLQEVRVLRFLKQPGDSIKRDEHIYEMETDKAIMEVESPYEGVLKEWLAQEGDVLPIGAPIARIESESAVEGYAPTAPATAAPAPNVAMAPTESAVRPAPPRPAAGRTEVLIPPRTRAYCRQQGISEEEMRQIPALTGKLMPEDVDRYLAEKAAGSEQQAAAVAAPPTAYTDRPLLPQQRAFIYRVKRSVQLVVPGTIKRPVEWSAVQRVVEAYRKRTNDVQPSEFQIFAYCVAQVVQDHPKFRSTLIGEETIREWHHINLGIAVARPNDELVTAVVPEADTLDFPAFIRVLQSAIRRARQGEDQANESVQLLLTYMGGHEITDAVAVLVAPAVAVLFAGASYQQEGKLLTNLALTFDHRLINGVGAANFLNAVAQMIQTIDTKLL